MSVRLSSQTAKQPLKLLSHLSLIALISCTVVTPAWADPAMQGDAAMNQPEMVDGLIESMRMEVGLPPMHPTVDLKESAEDSAKLALFERAHEAFKLHCFKCHGPTKQKGDYRMDSEHSIRQGGKSELPAIVPGNLEESELVYRILLPRDDEDVMPPEDKEPLSAETIEAIRAWIQSGADWPDESSRAKYADSYVAVGDQATNQLIEAIAQTGVKAEYNAWGDDSVRVDLGVVEPGQLDNALQQLSRFKNKLSWLDSSKLELPEGFFKTLPEYKKLERLHLDGSNVSDADLATLSKLPKLNYLNLYNTGISDTGLKHLQACSNLKQVYLSDTKATQTGIGALKTALPELEIIYR